MKMVASSKTMDSLKTIGLNKYERNLWVALLSRGASTAGELSDISNVPRSRCYDVLESLADKGFVVVQPGKPIRYVTIQPKEAMIRAKKRIQEDAIELNERIDRLVKSDVIRELERLHKENIKRIRPEELTGALKGRYAMHQQMETMFKKAKKSIKLMTTQDGLIELMEKHSTYLKDASQGGVKVQILAPIDKKMLGTVKNLSKYAQIRNTGSIEVLGRLYVVDGEEFILGLTDDSKIHPTEDVAFWTQSNHASTSIFEPMFELMWQNSKPVK